MKSKRKPLWKRAYEYTTRIEEASPGISSAFSGEDMDEAWKAGYRAAMRDSRTAAATARAKRKTK